MGESIKKNKKGILLMIVSSLLACIGQLLFKLWAQKGIWCIFFGFGFYGLGATCMLVAYKFGKLSVLQPILSMNYIFSLLLGAFILKESISLSKVVGVFVVMSGVVLIAVGDEE